MKKKLPIILGIIALTLAVLGFSVVSCTRIDAGHVGIKVNLYGEEKGVQDIVEVTGFVWYSPLYTKIYEFPTYIQHKVWSKDPQEDSPRNEEFTVTTRDGLSVSFDVGLDYAVLPEKVPFIFRKYRKSLPEITSEFIRTMVRNGYNNTASGYTAEDLVSNRAEYEAKVMARLIGELEKEGFALSQIAIIGKIRLPPTIEDAINAKIRAVQDAITAEREKQRIVAEAQKKIEEAKGEAESIRIRAEGSAAANDFTNRTLTPMLIQKMFIEKWDGKLPVYGETPKLFKSVN